MTRFARMFCKLHMCLRCHLLQQRCRWDVVIWTAAAVSWRVNSLLSTDHKSRQRCGLEEGSRRAAADTQAAQPQPEAGDRKVAAPYLHAVAGAPPVSLNSKNLNIFCMLKYS